jgi:type VI protein secretion system component Hcp
VSSRAGHPTANGELTLPLSQLCGEDKGKRTREPNIRRKRFMLKKILVLFVLALTCASVALAQDARARLQGRSTISVTVDGFTCNNNSATIPALSWSFGVSTPTQTNTGGGGSIARANLSDLNVTRRADGCTPFLFAASVSGKSFNHVTIVQQDTQKDDTFTVTLTKVLISSYQLGGDHSNEVPSEQIGFSYEGICVADTGTGNKSCWDLTQGKPF